MGKYTVSGILESFATSTERQKYSYRVLAKSMSFQVKDSGMGNRDVKID